MPRVYQQELFRRSLEQNVTVKLDTVSSSA